MLLFVFERGGVGVHSHCHQVHLMGAVNNILKELLPYHLGQGQVKVDKRGKTVTAAKYVN